MAEMLLINPRRRRRSARRRNPVRLSAVRRNPVARRRKRVTRRRSNPMPLFPVARATVGRRRMRRRNPIAMRRRIRRNPVYTGMLMAAIRNAFVGGLGSIAVDLAMGQINRVLPANLRVTAGSVGAGDAIKAVITVMLGHFLARPTRGLSRKMAEGALTVQAANLMKPLATQIGLPLGYYNPGLVTNGTPGVPSAMGAYTRGSPLLSAYTRRGGPTPLLSKMRSTSALEREGVSTFR